ncbi:hypothetical protein P3T22_004520 [Paraburkholderia sp. GAS348]
MAFLLVILYVLLIVLTGCFALHAVWHQVIGIR